MSIFVMFGSFVLVLVFWFCVIWSLWYGTVWHVRGLIVAVLVVLIVLWRLQI